jgi:hypothetical protein
VLRIQKRFLEPVERSTPRRGASRPNLVERFSAGITDKRIRIAGKGEKT